MCKMYAKCCLKSGTVIVHGSHTTFKSGTSNGTCVDTGIPYPLEMDQREGHPVQCLILMIMLHIRLKLWISKDIDDRRPCGRHCGPMFSWFGGGAVSFLQNAWVAETRSTDLVAWPRAVAWVHSRWTDDVEPLLICWPSLNAPPVNPCVPGTKSAKCCVSMLIDTEFFYCYLWFSCFSTLEWRGKETCWPSPWSLCSASTSSTEARMFNCATEGACTDRSWLALPEEWYCIESSIFLT